MDNLLYTISGPFIKKRNKKKSITPHPKKKEGKDLFSPTLIVKKSLPSSLPDKFKFKSLNSIPIRGVYSSLQLNILPNAHFFNLVFLFNIYGPPFPLSQLIFFTTALILKGKRYCFPLHPCACYILPHSLDIPFPFLKT